MLSTIFNFLYILFAITFSIYLVYKGRMGILAREVFIEENKIRSSKSIERLNANLEPLIQTNRAFEQFNNQQKESSRLMCFVDSKKECSYCGGEEGENCPIGKGGGSK